MLKGFPNFLITKLKIKLPAPSDMALKRMLDTDEQKARVVQAVKGLGIFPIEKIYKDYYQMSDSEIKEAKEGVKKDQEEIGMGQNPAMAGGALPPPPGAPLPPGDPAAAGAPQPTPESLDYDAMKSLAIESGCDQELIKLLEDMRAKEHFNKISVKDGPK